MKTPVMEAEFAHDERSALSLYNCLIPALREHRRLRIQPQLLQKYNLIEDIHAKKKALQLEVTL